MGSRVRGIWGGDAGAAGYAGLDGDSGYAGLGGGFPAGPGAGPDEDPQ